MKCNMKPSKDSSNDGYSLVLQSYAAVKDI